MPYPRQFGYLLFAEKITIHLFGSPQDSYVKGVVD